MLFMLFALSVWSGCGAQLYLYGGPAQFRRAPVRRSPMEALERLRAPRYYPQVDYAEEFALPPQWSDTSALYGDEPNDEDEYEYESQPLYRTPAETYPEQLQEAPSYGDLVRSYMLPPPAEQPPVFLQRRSDSAPPPPTPLTPTTSTSAHLLQTASPAPARVQSLVLPDPQSSSGVDVGRGQKEEPLFRPLHTSQRTAEWPQHKSPIPMLKQMIQGQQKKQSSPDPLLDELSSLKKV